MPRPRDDDWEALLGAALRGEHAEWPVSEAAIGRFRQLVRYHGVAPLLNLRLAERPSRWPADALQACRAEAVSSAVADLHSRAEVRSIVDRMDAAGIRPIVLKGTALAYSHYASPELRPRGDVDLLIPARDLERCTELLVQCGYAGGESLRSRWFPNQATWSRRDASGWVHDIDLHWQVSTSQVLAKLLDYDELLGSAVPLPTLDVRVLAPSPVHCLLFACMHWAGSRNGYYFVGESAYLGNERLIWFYDVHLLLSSLSEAEVAEFVRLAAAKRIRGICRDALVGSMTRFRTRVPPDVLEELGHGADAEPATRYLAGGYLRQLVGDVLALDTWKDRATYLRERSFPSGGYMLQQRYPDARIRWLPYLYLRRGLDKVARVFTVRQSGR